MKIPTYSAVIFSLTTSGAAFANGSEAATVEIRNQQFHPENLMVAVGTTVTWINMEKRQYHSVWFEVEGFPEADYFFPEETWERTFDKPGAYHYRCGPHPEMTGTITVE